MIFEELQPAQQFNVVDPHNLGSRSMQGKPKGPFIKAFRGIVGRDTLLYNATCISTGLICIFADDIEVTPYDAEGTDPEAPSKNSD